MRRVWCASVVLVVLLLACGGDSTPTSTAGGSQSSSTSGGTSTTSASTSSSTSSSTSTSTPTSSTDSSSSSSVGTITAKVFFLDQEAFSTGHQPFTRPVDRTVSSVTPALDALTALFAGPTAEESASGLRFAASGATGFTNLQIDAGIARVQLTGGCSSGGSTFSIADEISATLRQFDSVQYVKIYDPAGSTESPDGPGDSIPFCLEP